MEPHRIVSREEWLAAHKAHLAEEKALTHARDALAKKRRALPMGEGRALTYTFDTPQGCKTLAELFNGRSQLIVYHFMLGPDWEEGCPGCSFVSDHIDGALQHVERRDVAYVAVSRAPLEKIEAFKKRMGWKFHWVSSYGSDFNYDYHVSFTPEERAKGKVNYNFEMNDVAAGGFRQRRVYPESACSTRTMRAMCSIRSRRMDAAASRSSAPTTCSISRRKAATNSTTWVTGCVITIVMTKCVTAQVAARLPSTKPGTAATSRTRRTLQAGIGTVCP